MKYDNISVNQFCEYLYKDIGNIETSYDIYQYLKHITNNFDKSIFDYVIKDIRDYAYLLPFTDAFFGKFGEDGRTGYSIYDINKGWVEYTIKSINDKVLLFSYIPKINRKELIGNLLENPPVSDYFTSPLYFEENLTLSSRIEIIYKKIPHIHFRPGIYNLIEFSEIAEKEFKKTFDNHEPIIVENEENKLPKHNNSKLLSELTDNCLIKIMNCLIEEKCLHDKTDADLWLYWFNRKAIIDKPQALKWIVSPNMLANVIQHICGECVKNTVKVVFNVEKIPNPTKNKYRKSKIFDKIRQIIILYNKKDS